MVDDTTFAHFCNLFLDYGIVVVREISCRKFCHNSERRRKVYL